MTKRGKLNKGSITRPALDQPRISTRNILTFDYFVILTCVYAQLSFFYKGLVAATLGKLC